MCSCHSILECCVTFSGVKLSIRSFVLLHQFLGKVTKFQVLDFSISKAVSIKDREWWKPPPPVVGGDP